MKTPNGFCYQPLLTDKRRNDKDTLHLSNNSLVIESSAIQLKDQLERYKDKLSESFAILGGNNKTIISQISNHNNSGFFFGGDGARQAVTHRNSKDRNNQQFGGQKHPSTYYQDSMREAIQVIIRKLDEKIEATSKS